MTKLSQKQQHISAIFMTKTPLSGNKSMTHAKKKRPEGRFILLDFDLPATLEETLHKIVINHGQETRPS